MDDATVLVIDDEPQIRRVVRHALEEVVTRVLEADTARVGLDIAASARVDLIVLDLGLPDKSGLEVCRDVRGWTTVPVVVLTARDSEAEKVKLLDAGADDYVTKPFSTAEFQARVRAQLRRSRIPPRTAEAIVSVDGLIIDMSRRIVLRDDVLVHLTPIEWDLLRVLASNAGRTMTHGRLFAQVWTRSHGDAQAYLRVHIANLRRKIERDPVRPRYIITEPGVGYRFAAGVE
jgi:two-component system KDP operon response regulator KdpE